MLLKNVAVNDAIINAAQMLLKLQYPDFAGFQSTLLGNALKFKSVSRYVKSIQLLNTGKSVT